MRVKVIKDSVIYKQNIYKKNDEFDCDGKIAISLMERGYVAIYDNEETAQTLADEGVDCLDVPFKREQLEAMERADLVSLAKDLGVKASGKSDEIIERILEFHADEEDAYDESDEATDDAPNTGMPE